MSWGELQARWTEHPQPPTAGPWFFVATGACLERLVVNSLEGARGWQRIARLAPVEYRATIWEDDR